MIMSNYHDFYGEILGELDFSIIGYKSISETINDFFYEISDSSLLEELAHLDFISYSYAQVSDINTWKLSPMSSEYPFYYKSFSEEKNLLYTLSLYYDFKDFLKPLYGGGASRLIVSEIISKVFNRPTPYRVKIADSKHSSVCYDDNLDVITFEISLQSLLKKGSKFTLQGLKTEFATNFFDQVVENDLDPRLEKKENTFKIKNRRLMGDLFFEKIFDKKKIEIEIERLGNESKGIVCGNRVKILNVSNDHEDSILKEWIKVIIGHGFLSIFSDRWVENIPSVTKVEINKSEEITKKSIGTLIIGYSSVNELDSSERALFRTIADKVSSVVTAQVVKEINEELLSQAKSSAISKVMARNMSHNIGSHVLSRLAKKYSKEQISNIDNSVSTDDLAKFGHFFSYLMRRMDFLADIATTVPIMTTSSEFLKDILNPFINNTFIKNYITGNDLGFDVNPPFTGPKGLYVSMPNDILGKQAIYTILENIIRNTAKHGNHKRDEFSIDIECMIDTKYPDYIKVTVYDDSINENVETLKIELNKKIDLELLDQNSSLRKEAWGMLEKKIAAAYLRKITLSSIDKKKWSTHSLESGTPPLLKATVVNDVHLGYEFYLLKPKEGVILQHDRNIQVLNFGESSVEKTQCNEVEELSDFSIIGLNQKELSSSDVAHFDTHKGKFTRRLLKSFDSTESGANIESMWQRWLKFIALKKNIKNVQVVFQTEKLVQETIADVGIAEHGKTLKAVFVHHPNEELPDADFIESTTNNSLFYRFKSAVNVSSQLKYYLLEGILTKIILLDERIQEFTTNSTLDESIPISLQQYYEKMGIFVPSKEACWLNDPYSSIYREKVQGWLEYTISDADFLVVHIGVLEKLLQLSNYSDTDKLFQIEKFVEYLSNYLPDIYTKIIFISGRGRPDTIPAKYRFLNYSNIDQLLEKRICKSTLTGLLYSARSYEEII